MVETRNRFDRLSTATKLLLFLTFALLPLGLVLAWSAFENLRHSSRVANAVAERQVGSAARAIESLVARNALALKVASTGSIAAGARACDLTEEALRLTPAMAQAFTIRDARGDAICSSGDINSGREDLPAAPSAIKLWVSPSDKALYYRVGLVGGMATGNIPLDELVTVVRDAEPELRSLTIDDGENRIEVIKDTLGASGQERELSRQIGNRQLLVEGRAPLRSAGFNDRLAILLPLLMLLIAAVLSWHLVRQLLLLPAARLQRAVDSYQPGSGQLVLPEKLGPAEEVRLLGRAFERAVDRLEDSENQMADALAGQQRLVREVHHRVKNNLQVIASMLSIHGRNASTPESRAAYAAIGRRVDALAVVHRNHFAEVEDNRGIALRPMLVELAATLKASAPESAVGMAIKLESEPLNTTQDTAIAVSFFVTEIVEFAMLGKTPTDVDIDLDRLSELAARLTVSSDALIVGDDDDRTKRRKEFDRVVGGLARQLRSQLEEKMGRLSVVIPVFPDPA